MLQVKLGQQTKQSTVNRWSRDRRRCSPVDKGSDEGGDEDVAGATGGAGPAAGAVGNG